jgi:hypothetical protein
MKNAEGKNITFGAAVFRRRLDGAKLASGEAVLNALVGGSGKTFRESMENDQRAALMTDSTQLVPDFPEVWAYSEVNKLRIKDLPGPGAVKYVGMMNLGSRANFFATEQDRDIVKVAEHAYRLLESFSPVGVKDSPGFLKMRHEIYIDERIHRMGQSTPTTPDSFAFLTNRTEYASTLESQSYKIRHKAYARTFTALKRKYGRDWSIVYLFLDPTKLGGHLRKPRRASATAIYAIPAIFIAPLNTLPYSPTVRANSRRTVWGRKSRRLENIMAQRIRAAGKRRIK